MKYDATKYMNEYEYKCILGDSSISFQPTGVQQPLLKKSADGGGVGLGLQLMPGPG